MSTLCLKLTKIRATGKQQIHRFQTPHSALTTAVREKMSTYTCNLYFQKLESSGYIFAADGI